MSKYIQTKIDTICGQHRLAKAVLFDATKFVNHQRTCGADGGMTIGPCHEKKLLFAFFLEQQKESAPRQERSKMKIFRTPKIIRSNLHNCTSFKWHKLNSVPLMPRRHILSDRRKDAKTLCHKA